MKKETNKKDKKGRDNTGQGQPDFHPGSTTQGGSDYGQGSSYLGKDANKQGSEKNEGSNYENEEDFNLE